MRTVAKFQINTSGEDKSIGDKIIAIIRSWAAEKFTILPDGSLIIKRSKIPALFEEKVDSLEDLELISFTIIENIEGGNLETAVRILKNSDRTAFQCVLGVGSESGLAPPSVSLRSPRFIRSIIDLGNSWFIGNLSERVFSRSFFACAVDINEFQSLLISGDRRLPIVVVSELNGETLGGDLHERLATNLCGLAHTVRLSEDASWELTHRMGQEWSCFNGAVRIFWPFRANRDYSRAHPLWTLDGILSRAETETAARDRFVALITQKLIEASTFVSDDPIFREFDGAKLRQATETARIISKNSGNFESLAEAYASENDILRKQLAEYEKELTDLRQNVETLAISLRSVQTDSESYIDESPPKTVSEAILTAKKELTSVLIIASETERDWEQLNPSAGPPEKILRYLRTLGRMSSILAEGAPLGASIPIWLRQQNVECSGDSQTKKTSKAERSFRTRMIEGILFECDFHAKPSDGTSPDMCVRIYFCISQESPKIRIGYIGRHND